MRDDFDVYHRWLGIPPSEQPANYYRLLGLSLFEQNDEVIRSAAEQRQTFLRTFQQGQGADRSQQLLNEITRAKLCLLDSNRRADYDAGLQLAATQSPRVNPLPAASDAASSPAVPDNSAADEAAAYPSAPFVAPNEQPLPELDPRLAANAPRSSIPAWLGLAVSVTSALAVVSFVVVLLLVMVSWWTAPEVTEVAAKATDQSSTDDDSGTPPAPASSTDVEPVATVTDSNPSSPDTASGDTAGTEATAPAATGDQGNPVTLPTDDQSTTGQSTLTPTESNDTPPQTAESTAPDDPVTIPDPIEENSPDSPVDSGAADPGPESTARLVVIETELTAAREKLRQEIGLDLTADPALSLPAYNQLWDVSQHETRAAATRLAALLEARMIAWNLVDLTRLSRTADSILANFEIDLATIDREGCITALDRAMTQEEFAKLWWLANEVSGQLLSSDRPAQAQEISLAFEKAARGDVGKPYRRWIADQRRDLDRWTDARALLPKGSLTDVDPQDLTPAQNRSVGLWLTDALEDWPAGLNFLANCSDPVIQPVAELDLQRTDESPAAIFEASDAWIAASDQLEDELQDWARRRAKLLLARIDLSQIEDTHRDQLAVRLGELRTATGRDEAGDFALPFAGRFASRVELIDRGTLLDVGSEVTAIALTPDESRVGIGTKRGIVHVVELLSGSQQDDVVGNGRSVEALSWYPDASRIIVATRNGELKTWDLRRGTAEDSSAELSANITHVAVGPKGRTVVGASSDGTVYFWNGSNGRLLTAARDHRREVTTLSVSEDGRLMLTGGADQKAQLWNDDGPLARLNGHFAPLTCSALSFDSLFAATADSRGQIFVWSAVDGTRLAQLPQIDDADVVGLCFLRQWPRLAVLTDDSRLRVFDLATQTWSSELTLDIEDVTTMGHDRHGRWIVIGNQDGEVRLIEVGASL